MNSFNSFDGTRIAFQQWGDGQPVLALSGLTRNSSDFDYLAPHLSGVRLIAMDYRGRGQSEWSGAETYTIQSEMQDALALLDHLGIERAGVIGTSRGGIISMAMGLAAPTRLLGVCLVDIGPELMASGLAAIMNYLGRNPTQKTYDHAAKMRAELMTGFDNVAPSRWAEEVRKHYIENEAGLRINYDPALRDAVLKNSALPAPDLWPMFDSLHKVPLGLIRGANSDLLSLETAMEMKHRRPDMLFEDVPDRGHVPFLDEPQSLDVINNWLRLL